MFDVLWLTLCPEVPVALKLGGIATITITITVAVTAAATDL